VLNSATLPLQESENSSCQCGLESPDAITNGSRLHAGATRPEEEEDKEQEREGPEGPEWVEKISCWKMLFRAILTWLKNAIVSADLYLERGPGLSELEDTVIAQSRNAARTNLNHLTS